MASTVPTEIQDINGDGRIGLAEDIRELKAALNDILNMFI